MISLEPALALIVVWTAAGRSDILTCCSFSSSAERGDQAPSVSTVATAIPGIICFMSFVLFWVRRADASIIAFGAKSLIHSNADSLSVHPQIDMRLRRRGT